MSELQVLHESKTYVLIEKPSGLRSVPGRGAETDPAIADSVETRFRARYPEATGPVMVHRLDLDTSGLLVVARTREAHRALSRQFMYRKTGKRYEALLDGLVDANEGKVELPLIVDWPNRPRQKVDFETGKPALTRFRVLERVDGLTRVDLRPETGRTHQLRVHACTPVEDGGIGHPILGDSLYGDGERAERLMLHAARLSFWDPEDGQWRNFDSEVPF
ncbi:MAG: RluA family pseudouridine synthase [Phycisphaerales bacterium]|nr:RluA family pseudouridine synthase [Phycisphaerales bacterium]